MTPEAALATLVRAALSPSQLMAGPALALRKIVQDALDTPTTDTSQIESLKQEKIDLLLRVAELEEELAELQKPQRRNTRKKNDADSGDTGSS
jgi:hypothetical protein